MLYYAYLPQFKKEYLVEPSFGFPEKQILRQGLQGLGFRLSGEWSQEAPGRKQGKWDGESQMLVQAGAKEQPPSVGNCCLALSTRQTTT